MRRLVLSLLERPDGIYVFQRRDMKAPTSPGMLALFGGHMSKIDEGVPLEGIWRELGEETDLPMDDLGPQHVMYREVPAEFSSSGEVTAVDLFTTFIGRRTIQVFEGAGSEEYTLSEALSRNDMATTVRFLLEDMPRKA